MPISRRRFLSASGGSLAAVALHTFSLPGSQHTPPPLTRMRALTTARLFSRADPAAPIVRHVWQHELLPLRDIDADWAYTDDGCLPAADVQLIAAPGPAHPVSEAGWAEVIAPYATLHDWADDDAPQRALIPIGGVLHAFDRLETRRGTWLALTLEEGVTGWSRATAWGKAMFHEPISGSWTLTAHRAAGQVKVCDEYGALIWSVSTAIDAPPGTSAIVRRTPGGKLVDADGTHHGVPALLYTDEVCIFGRAWAAKTVSPGMLPIPVWAARWLFVRVARVAVI